MTQRYSHRYLSLLVVGLIVLSGCSGIGSDVGETPTPTETLPTATDTPTPTTDTQPSDEMFAPGVSSTGITDSEALLTAHREALLADGTQIQLTVTREAESGAIIEQSTQTAQITPNASEVSVSGSGFGPDGERQVDSWLNETTSLFRFQAENETEYRVLEAAPGRTELVFAGNIGLYVRAVSDTFTVLSIEERDGQRLATLRSEADLVNETAGPDTEIEMTVDSTGIIRSFTLNQTQPDNERYHLEYAVEQTDVTVERPDWVDTIPAGVFLETDVSIESEDGAAVMIANAGPDAVPAGATVTIVADGVTYDATIPDAIEADEHLWVWVDSESGALTVGLEQPSTDAVRVLGMQAAVVVRTNDGIRLASADFTWRTGRDSR